MSASAPMVACWQPWAAWTRFRSGTLRQASKVRDLTSSPLANLTNSVGNLGAMGNPAQIMKNARKSGMPANMPQMPSMADLTGNDDEYDGRNVCGTMGRTVTSLAFSPDGGTLAVGGVESKSNFDAAAMMGTVKTNPRTKNNRHPIPRTS